MAMRTISAEVEALNLANSFFRYQRMVSTPRHSVPAICGVVWPAATRRSTCCSRSVREICVSFIVRFIRSSTNFTNSSALNTTRKGGNASFPRWNVADWRFFDNFVT